MESPFLFPARHRSANRCEHSYRFFFPPISEGMGQGNYVNIAPAGDIDADGMGDFLVGMVNYNDGADEPWNSAVYHVAAADLAAADAADGEADRSINLASIHYRPGSWKIVGEDKRDRAGTGVSSAGDVNGDGHPDLMIGAPIMPLGTNPHAGRAIVLSGGAMSTLDGADGDTDGVIMIRQIRQDGTWQLGGKDFDIGEAVSAAGRKWSCQPGNGAKRKRNLQPTSFPPPSCRCRIDRTARPTASSHSTASLAAGSANKGFRWQNVRCCAAK